MQDALFEAPPITCQVPPDSVALTATCGEQNPRCAQGDAPLDDSDCDGLPLGADPDPASCNRLLFVEAFTEPFEARWEVAAGSPSWRCGQLVLPAGSQIKLSQRPPVGFNQPYLIEVKLTLGPITTFDPWVIEVLQDSSSAGPGMDPYGRYCALWVDSTYKANPGLHVWHGSPCGGGAWTSQSNLDTSEGKEYLLQTVYSGDQLECRLYDSPGVLVEPYGSRSRSACNIGQEGFWRIMTQGIEATLHYVRIWEISSGF